MEHWQIESLLLVYEAILCYFKVWCAHFFTLEHCSPGRHWRSTGLSPDWSGSLQETCRQYSLPGWSQPQWTAFGGKPSSCSLPWQQTPMCNLPGVLKVACNQLTNLLLHFWLGWITLSNTLKMNRICLNDQFSGGIKWPTNLFTKCVLHCDISESSR